MSYSHLGCGPSSGARPCGCGCRGGRAQFGERYEPEVFDDAPGVGAPPRPRRPGTIGGRVVSHLKGKLGEKLMTRTATAHAALAEAKLRALKEGMDPTTVKFTRNVQGIHNVGPPRQLTDGVIYGRTKDGRVRIFNVFESKARSDITDVAIRARGDLGQIARDFERLRQLPVKIDGQIHQPNRVIVSRNQTAWTVFAPRDVAPTPAHRHEIVKRSGFDFRPAQLPLTNDQLWSHATRLATSLTPRRKP